MRVLTFGTFDNLHPGHLDYFRQARRFGASQLISAVRQAAKTYGMKRLLVKGAKANRKAIKKAEAKGGVELIVVVARDKNVLQIKGRWPHEDEKRRIKKVRMALKDIIEEGSAEPRRGRGLSLSDQAGVVIQPVFHARAVLGAIKNQWAVLEKYRPEIICLGYDQKTDLRKLKEEIAKFCPGCKIKRMKAHYPERYKSSYCLK